MVSRQSVTVVLNLKGNNNLGIQSGQRESSSPEGRNVKRVKRPARGNAALVIFRP